MEHILGEDNWLLRRGHRLGTTPRAGLRYLFRLVHPDRNDGSEQAHLATQELNKLKERVWPFEEAALNYIPFPSLSERSILAAQADVDAAEQGSAAEEPPASTAEPAPQAPAEEEAPAEEPPASTAEPAPQAPAEEEAPAEESNVEAGEEAGVEADEEADTEAGEEADVEADEEAGEEPELERDPEDCSKGAWLRWEPINIKSLDHALSLDAIRRLDEFNAFEVLHSLRVRAVRIRGTVGYIPVLQRNCSSAPGLRARVCCGVGKLPPKAQPNKKRKATDEDEGKATEDARAAAIAKLPPAIRRKLALLPEHLCGPLGLPLQQADPLHRPRRPGRGGD